MVVDVQLALVGKYGTLEKYKDCGGKGEDGRAWKTIIFSLMGKAREKFIEKESSWSLVDEMY